MLLTPTSSIVSVIVVEGRASDAFTSGKASTSTVAQPDCVVDNESLWFSFLRRKLVNWYVVSADNCSVNDSQRTSFTLPMGSVIWHSLTDTFSFEELSAKTA